MTPILDHPVLLLVVSLALLYLSVRTGIAISKKLHPRRDEREDLGVVIRAALTLLALIIGFSFSMAVSRYEQRVNYEEEETNAIGTEYVRADLLPGSDAAKIRDLLTRYAEQRLLFYTSRNARQLERIDSETAKLQNEMWFIVQAAASARPTPPVALAVSGMNDVLNTQGYTQAAWRNRIPAGAWTLMVALAVCCCVLVGYDSHRSRNFLFAVLPLIVSITFFLIGDIDSPNQGVIRVLPRNLIALSQSLHKH